MAAAHGSETRATHAAAAHSVPNWMSGRLPLVSAAVLGELIPLPVSLKWGGDGGGSAAPGTKSSAHPPHAIERLDVMPSEHVHVHGACSGGSPGAVPGAHHRHRRNALPSTAIQSGLRVTRSGVPVRILLCGSVLWVPASGQAWTRHRHMHSAQSNSVQGEPLHEGSRRARGTTAWTLKRHSPASA